MNKVSEKDKELFDIFDLPLEELVELSMFSGDRSRNSLYLEVVLNYLAHDSKKLQLVVTIRLFYRIYNQCLTKICKNEKFSLFINNCFRSCSFHLM